MLRERVISRHLTRTGASRFLRDLEELRGSGDTNRVLTDEQFDVLRWAGAGPAFVYRRRRWRWEVLMQQQQPATMWEWQWPRVRSQ